MTTEVPATGFEAATPKSELAISEQEATTMDDFMLGDRSDGIFPNEKKDSVVHYIGGSNEVVLLLVL